MEHTMLQRAAPSSETNIRLRRPTLSDSAAAQKIATARNPVDNDSDRELAAGVTLKWVAKIGISGCTQ
jgi:hypothetical protein